MDYLRKMTCKTIKIFLFFLFFSLPFCCYPAEKNTSSFTEQDHFFLPAGTHLVIAKGIDGSLIEIENGAQFQVASGDEEDVLEWSRYAPVVISPNPYWFSSSDFFITNRQTGTFISAKYVTKPVKNHRFTHQIFHLDPYYGEIVLSNELGEKTLWKVEKKDWELMRNWEKGEPIIIGIYDNWYSCFASDAEFILIYYENRNSVKYVRAVPESP
jgi:hypothetical protein